MMKDNTNEKNLVVIKKKNIFSKILDFFNSVFSKDKEKTQSSDIDDIKYKKENVVKKNNFVIIDDIEKKFQDFRRGYIKEEDLTEEEKRQLTLKYQERIKKEQEEIEYFKKKILEIREKYLKDV